ncbi:MAG: iron-containing alcohol dehydrogenase [Brevinema sp.]
MYSFKSYNPTQFLFGAGTVKEVGKVAKEHGKRALLVTYNFPYFQSLAKQVSDLLAAENISCVILDNLKAEPITTDAIEGGQLALKEKCDMVIGLGGGSVLDMAKGVAHCAVHPDRITDYMYGKAEGKSALPIILVPTTAGTGSEGNHYAVFTNPETNDKKALITRHLFAKTAILDPELLVTLPPKVIAGPGLDALYHCIEAYFSTDSTLTSEMYSLEGIRILGKLLHTVYKDSSNVEAWQKVQFASLLGGLAIGAADVGIPHALGHPIGGLYHITHAETLTPTFKAYLRYVSQQAPEKALNVAQALGKQDVVSAVCDIIESVDMNISLTDIGVQQKDLPWIINNALTVMGSSIRTTPGNPDEKVLERILQESF